MAPADGLRSAPNHATVVLQDHATQPLIAGGLLVAF